MQKYCRLLLSFILSLHFAFAQTSSHVVLISIDGLRPEMYQDSRWPTPNLQILMKQGVYAKHMKSVFPSYTYPSHTAMLTGALPARSGIYYNAKMGSEDWNWFTKDIKVPTLWQAMKQSGLTTAAVEWPVSVDTSITYDIPEIWNPATAEDRITEVRRYATPGLIEDIEQNATGKLSGENMNEEYLSLDANAGRMAAYIFKTYKPAFLALHFAGVDGAEHGYGRDGDSVRLAVANADRAISDVLEAIERSKLKDVTTIIIVGDHGFSDMKQVLRPNIWIKDIPARFQAAGGSAFLNVQEAKATEEVKKVLNELPVQYRKLFKIFDRKKLDQMGADSSATLALAAVPGIVFSGSTEGEQLTRISGGHHGYDPNLPEMYTGFIAAGAGINKGKSIDELCVTDIAPLIAELLGIEFKVPDGKLIPGITK